jgi:hypothetical protein
VSVSDVQSSTFRGINEENAAKRPPVPGCRHRDECAREPRTQLQRFAFELGLGRCVKTLASPRLGLHLAAAAVEDRAAEQNCAPTLNRW